jgi:transposase
MPRTYKLTAEHRAELEQARKTNQDKQTEKRLHAVQLRAEGETNVIIAQKLDTSAIVVSRWTGTYVNKGLSALLPKKREAHRRNMSYDDESALLEQFEEKAKAGQVVEVSEIKRVYEEKVGHRIGKGQIYRVLNRHNWRKVMPRSQHPKKASVEVIEASKKLTLESKN